MSKHLSIITPTNWLNPLTIGLKARFQAFPNLHGGGRRLTNIVWPGDKDALHGTLTGFSSYSDAWVGPSGRQGGRGAIKCLSGHYVPTNQSAYAIGIRQHATFTGWVCITTTGAVAHVLLSDWSGSNGFNLRLDDTTGTTIYVYPNNHRVNVATTNTVGVWYWVAGVMNGANLYLYRATGAGPVALLGSTTLGEDIGSSGVPITIAARADLGDGYSTAIYDCLTVHNRALSLGELTAWRDATLREFDPTLNWIEQRAMAPAVAAGGTILPQMMQHYYSGAA